jgi:hypothetical protein
MDPVSGNIFDPGSGIRDGKIRFWDEHPESATLTEKLLEYLTNTVIG